MPVSISYQELYRLEYEQMQREGYALEGVARASAGAGTLPIAAVRPEGTIHTPAEEAYWQEAYARLIAGKARGIRADFPYVEPNDLESILADAPPPPPLVPLPEADYEDRVRGGWFGRCAAVILGKPLEMGFNRQQVKDYLASVDAYPLDDFVPAASEKLGITLRRDCVPSTRGNVAYVQSDDDIHYTICSLLLMEEHGEDFTHWDAGKNLLDNITYHWVWTADRALYGNLINLRHDEPYDAQCARMGALLNPWRESMCPQLKSDFWGYITPGQGRRGARMMHRLASLSATQNGLYGGLFMQGCVSAALTQHPTVDAILRGGLSNIPRRSRLYEAVERVMAWHAQGAGWEAVCDSIYAAYGDWYFAGAINNVCFIVLALLEGNLDFESTITTAVMCGTDTDCNSANAGSIVGAALGYRALPRKWIDPLHDQVRSCVAGFGWGSISELAARTVAARARMDAR